MKKGSEITIPKMLDQAGFRMESEKFAGFESELARAERRIDEIRSELCVFNNGQSDEIKTQAERLVAGSAIGAGGVGKSGSLSEELETLLGKRPVLREAVKLQRQKLDQARDDASLAVCSAAEDENAANLRNVTRSLIVLAEAVAQMYALINRLADGDAQTGWLRTLELNTLGDPTDFYSLTAQRLRDAYVWRVIEEEEIPKDWRDDWARQGYELRKFPRLESVFLLEKRARAAKAA